MMTSRFCTTLLASCLLAASAGATTLQPRIVINDDDGAAAARALGAPFDSVVELRVYSDDSFTGQFNLCSGSLIAATTILTAQHCLLGTAASQVQVRFTDGDGNLQFQRTVSTIQVMPGYQELTDGTDVATLTLADPVENRTPFLLTSEDVLGETVRMVGYGRNGLGSTGDEGTRDGARWAADNVIDQSILGAPYSGPNRLFSSKFLEPGDPDFIPFEGTTAPGDSGGPLLVQRSGDWTIAGVLSGGTSLTSQYGDRSVWTGLFSDSAQELVRLGGGQFYDDEAVIPLPASGWLLLAALAITAGLGRRRAGAPPGGLSRARCRGLP